MKWIIQKDVFDNTDQICSTILEQGHELKIIDYEPYSMLGNIYSKDDCVISYGSLNLMLQLLRAKLFVPGVYCTFPNYRYSTYSKHFTKYLLNSDAKMYSLSSFSENNYIDDKLFIRPDSGIKPFAGEVITRAEFKDRIEFLSSLTDDKVYVSSYKPIDREWRFFARKNKIITGSLYMVNYNIISDSNYDQEAYDLACIIANIGYHPDPIYSIDICKSNGLYYLIEINSFSCAGIYNCNIDKLIKEVSAQALEDWDESNT